ncbi:hypothetical protein ACSHWB_03090 [Lentzea sp. HUAS TT2]|uniref:hypothetical protein n=1 Tax=Lentzea sp. HUAS TT2 TaxID=3447454 RepID=UPI003F707F87
MLRNLIGLLVIAAVAGCSSPPPAPSPPDKAATTAWLDQVCSGEKAVYTRGTAVSKAPKFTVDRPPVEADRAAVVTALTELREMFAKSKSVFDAIGPAPVAQGDDLVAANRRDLGAFIAKIDETLENARRLPAEQLTGPAEFVTKDVVFWNPSGPKLPDLIKAQPVLAEVYDQAPNC